MIGSVAAARGVHFDLSRSEVEDLLGHFLTGTQCIELGERVTDIQNLPTACREHVKSAADVGRAWAAWLTAYGAMAAWGDYDRVRSTKMRAHIMFVEWWLTSTGHHSLWCYCDPKRPTEWVVGRATSGDSH
jgi:hypothetical protein